MKQLSDLMLTGRVYKMQVAQPPLGNDLEATLVGLLFRRRLEGRFEQSFEGGIVGLVALVEPLEEHLEGGAGRSNVIAFDRRGAGEGVLGLLDALLAGRLLLLGALNLGRVGAATRGGRRGNGCELGANGHRTILLELATRRGKRTRQGYSPATPALFLQLRSTPETAERPLPSTSSALTPSHVLNVAK